MTVGNVDQFKGYRDSALHGIKVSTGRAETAVAAERDEFQLATVRTAIHGTAKEGVEVSKTLFYVWKIGD